VGHVVLLGDSILDNARYVPGGPAVIDHVRRVLPAGWRATLLASDGSVAAGVLRQLDRLPADATHLVISAGGNNALDQSSLVLHEPAGSFAEVLSRLAEIRVEFQSEYRQMLQSVLARGLPTAVCTIYDAIPGLERPEHMVVSLFNEVILREAFRAGVSVIDLRLICNEAADYARSSPIEPSVSAGFKIAGAVSRAIDDLNGTATGPRVIV
jgi:hypothetical protein